LSLDFPSQRFEPKSLECVMGILCSRQSC